jgi:hypothetical protein
LKHKSGNIGAKEERNAAPALGRIKGTHQDAYLAVVFAVFDSSLVVNVSPRFVDSIV